MSVKLSVDSVRQVYNDGNHNAFTDLCRFGDRVYLTFRSCPDGHMIFASSRIVVLSSADGGEWEEVFSFSVIDRDVRDPHFLVFKGRLFVYTGTWLCKLEPDEKSDLNDHLGYCAWTDDGATWHGPRWLEGTYGHYIWRAAAFDGKAYLCGRRRDAFLRVNQAPEGREGIQSALLESDDGFVWKTAGLFQETHGNETAFLFEDDGSILAVARRSGPAEICRSKPPYTEWTRTDLDRYIGGPLLVKWNERYLVAGRRATKGEGSRTAIYWLVDDQLEEIAVLPSGGDCSYPGFVALGPDRALFSYYSSHEGSGTALPPSNIYLAELSLRGT